MKIHDLVQGSPEWHAHRASHFNASDAPAMLGCSPYKTRSELLKEYATGFTKEVDAGTQKLFDDGHRFEAFARSIAEEIIGEELFPCVGSQHEYSASFDGLTMLGDVNFEHKTLNNELRDAMFDGCTGADLPKAYRVQMEQQHMVSECDRTLFMATKWDSEGALIEKRECWYKTDLQLRKEIGMGWIQFKSDLANYQHVEEAPKVVSGPVLNLPAVSVQVSGEIAIIDNLTAFGAALTDFVQKQLILEPTTDQDFADLETQIKTLKKAEDALNQAEAAALAQVATIDTMKRTKDMLHKLARDNRLMAEKLLDAKKQSIRVEIRQEGEAALKAHIDTLNKRLGGKVTLPVITGNFAGVMSGKKTVKSLRDAVDAELANCKIKANELADRMDINLQSLRELAAGKEFLFMDAQAIVQKENGDLVNLIKARIAEHDAKEQARLDEQREQIRKEEEAKAAAKVRLEQIAQQAKDDAAKAEAQKAIDDAAASTGIVRQHATEAHGTIPAQASADGLKIRVDRTTPDGSQLLSSHEVVGFSDGEPAQPRVIKVQIDGKPATKEQVELAVGIIRPSNAELVNVIAAHYNVKKIIAARWLLDAHNSITEAEVA